MRICLKRSLLYLGLLLFAVLTALYLLSAAIVEAVLLSKLEARGGQLEVEAIRLRMAGVEIELERYEESALLLKGMTVLYPWSQLWSLRDGVGGQLHFDEVGVRLEAGAQAGAEPVSPVIRLAALAAQIDALPLRGLEVVIDDLYLEAPGQVFHLGAALSLLRSSADEIHLTAALEGVGIDLDLRVKILAGGKGLALDFVGMASDWQAFQSTYLSALYEQLVEAQAELYFNPLSEGRGFLDVSGYARWDSGQADKLSFAVLANLGASELYLPEGELILQAASLGLAGDGGGTLRAYGKGTIDSVRFGSWMQMGGDWALRAEGAKLSAEVRVGDSLALSLGHEDWHQALAGSGLGHFYLETASVDAQWLRMLPMVEGVPDGLELDMNLQLKGQGAFKDFELEAASVDLDLEVREAALASKGLRLKGLSAQANGRVSEGSFHLSSLESEIQVMDIIDFSLRGLDFAATGHDDGTFTTQPLSAAFMGGTLQLEAMTIDPQNLEDLSLRARVDAVELAQLAEAVPQFKGQITGTVSGYLVGGWRGGQPILTDGRLEVDPERGARLQYNVDGLLTRGVLEGSTAYQHYRRAEKAFADLELKRLRIEVFPGGDATRPFRLELFGESEQDGTVVPVDFDLNVNVDDTAGLFEILRLMRRGELDLN